MARDLITARIDKLFRDKITGLIQSLSKKFKVYAVFVVKVPCPNCIQDAVSHESTGQYNGTGLKPFTGNICPSCMNNGSIASETPKKINVIVEWSQLAKADENRILAQGEIPFAHALVKGLTPDQEKLLTAHHFLVDGIRCVRTTEVRTSGLLSKATAQILVKRED